MRGTFPAPPWLRSVGHRGSRRAPWDGPAGPGGAGDLGKRRRFRSASASALPVDLERFGWGPLRARAAGSAAVRLGLEGELGDGAVVGFARVPRRPWHAAMPYCPG